jgi:osmotically-inducible protein OsmY
VRASLAFHNNVSAANTQVRTAKGVVTLTGQTPPSATSSPSWPRTSAASGR